MPTFSKLKFLQWLKKKVPNRRTRCARALLEAGLNIDTVYPLINGKISENPRPDTLEKILWAMDYLQ